MKGFYRHNYRLIKTNMSALIVFELLYKLVSVLVMYPLILAVLDLSIEKAGLSFLTNKNLGTFIRSPISIGMMGLAGIFIVIFAIYELVVITLCFELSYRGEKANALELAWAGFVRLKSFLHPSGFIYFFALLVIVTLLDFPFASSLVSVTGIPDYLHNYFERHPVFLAVGVGFAVLVLWWFGAYIFSLHYIIVGKTTARQAMRKTKAIIKGRRILINLRIFLWYILVFAALLVAYGLVLLLFAGAYRVFLSDRLQLTAYLSTARFLGNILSLVIYSFFTPVFLSVITTFFYYFKEKNLIDEPDQSFKIRKIKSHRIIVGGVAVILLITNFGLLSQSFSENVLRQIIFVRTPIITAHRGGTLRAPENTLAAVRQAIEENADFAEIDVRMTEDGVVVLMHDVNLKRTTGIDKNIWEVNFYDLEAMEAGSFFSNEFSGEKIPTLEEVLREADGKINFNIEIKTSKHTPELPKKVGEIILEYGLEKDCVVSSFSHSALKTIKSVSADIKTGLIITMPLGSYTNLPAVDFYSLNAVFVSRRQIEMIHRLGYEVHVWGAKDRNIVSRMYDYGADNIIAADPIMAREVILSYYADPIVTVVGKTVFGDQSINAKSVPFFPFRY
jgi:glycerophosphoryl diester phosphodiesterase